MPVASLLLVALVAASADDRSFDREVAPIFAKHCAECHADAADGEAKLGLVERNDVLYGALSGRIVVPGDSASSLLLQVVAAESKPHMPPDGQLSDAEIATLRRWVDRLAADALPPRSTAGSKDHWAYQPLSRTDPPKVRNEAWVRTSVDRFILAKLEAAGLEPSPPADPAALCRRVYFDLTGLPPTPEEVAEFVTRFSSPSHPLTLSPDHEGVKGRGGEKVTDAYEALVDKLLASPAYGERWGRHWLDLARYADSSGYHDDVDRPYAWRYRDYVVRSFNDDKPYAEFVAEQLAGDQVAPDDADAWIATGFCRNGPTNDLNMGNGTIKEKYRLDLLDDVLSTASAVFLGQTVGCARCHDHKFDPIAQADYYRLLAVFDETERVDVALDDEGHPAVVTPFEDKKKFKDKDDRPKWSIMALADKTGEPRVTRVLWRGEITNPGPVVKPGVPGALGGPAFSANKSTERRTALARWITAETNPLTWRVAANRIWQHHFGTGLVATPSNFGTTGAAPTHPELLDWLAQEFVKNGGRWKPLHRTILMSSAYRQASCQWSVASGQLADVDPENRLLWRFPKLRLEAEAMRDAVLAVAGTLNRKQGGPGVKPRIRPELLVASQRNKWPVVEIEGPEHWRRSLYIYVKRQLPFPMLELFDQPNPAQTCERRDENVVPTQALVLMNDEFVAEQAKHFADRVRREAGDDVKRQTARAVEIAFCRKAAKEEIAEGAAFIQSQSLVDLCHVLLNCNEFTYLD